jgi:hypothetical protein
LIIGLNLPAPQLEELETSNDVEPMESEVEEIENYGVHAIS